MPVLVLTESSAVYMVIVVFSTVKKEVLEQNETIEERCLLFVYCLLPHFRYEQIIFHFNNLILK